MEEMGREGSVREISSGLLVLGLLLSEEAGEGDDVGVDFLLLGGRVWVVGSHDCWYSVVYVYVVFLIVQTMFSSTVSEVRKKWYEEEGYNQRREKQRSEMAR